MLSVIGSLRTVTLIAMRGDRDDAPARRYGHRGRPAGPPSPALRTAGLAAGTCLAVAATVVVFLTDDPQVLRLAVVGAAWAFVLAALVRSRPAADVSSPAQGQLAAAERAELEALRAELASVGELRREMAQVAGLRREVAEIAGLRREVAEIAGLRTALAGLDLTALAELRTDVGRLRTELREQLSGGMLVERVMLGTASARSAPGPAAPRTPEADSRTSPAPDPTAAWPAVRADEPPAGTRQPDEVRAEPRRAPASPPPPPPLDWPAGRSLLTPPATPRPEAEPHLSRTDAPTPTAALLPDATLTTERPVAQRERPPVPGAAVPTAEVPGPVDEDPARRLADLVAESGLTPPSGGRRRRRYREDGESDDVLARVLGR
jgi:hypothetical protein